MPDFDGTGPSGQGQRTGRGRGKCCGLASDSIAKILAGIIVPVAGIVVNDIRKPNGITRQLFSSLKNRLFHKRMEHNEIHYIDEGKTENELNNI